MADVLPGVARIRRVRLSFSAAEWMRVSGLYGFIALFGVSDQATTLLAEH